MNSRLHQIAAIASAAVLALSVSACSSDDDNKKADSDKSATPSATPVTPAPAEQVALLDAIADAHADAKSVHVEVRLGPEGQQTKATADVEFTKKTKKPAMSASLEMDGNKDYSLSMIVLEPALYLNLGQTTGGKYGAVNLDDKKDESVAIQFTPLVDLLDPGTQLTTFKKALSSFEQKGKVREIDGVQVMPYEVVVDTSKLPGAEEPTEDAPKTATYDVFVGPDQLIRRVSSKGSDGGAYQMDYTKWGEPVKVKAPKSSEISASALDPLRGGS